MPAVEIEDKICRDCGNRGVLVADQCGQCTNCAGNDVVPWESLTPEEQDALANQ